MVFVATVLTVYGIETSSLCTTEGFTLTVLLQQYLPFTVLKLTEAEASPQSVKMLQQYLPFTGLKLVYNKPHRKIFVVVATVLTVYGIETR